MRLSIATKIFIAFSGVVLVFTLVIMASIWRTQKLYGQIQALNRSIVPLSLLLSDAQNDLKSFDVALSEPDPDSLERALQLARTMSLVPNRVLNKLQRAVDMTRRDPFAQLAEPERLRLAEIRTRLGRIAERAGALDEQTEQLYVLLGQRARADETAALDARILARRKTLRARTRELELALTRLRNDLRISTDLALVRANAYERSNLYALGIMSALALLVATALLGVALLTVRPINHLTEGVKRVAHGDYTPIEHQSPSILGRDELATLTDEFNSMARALVARDEALKEQQAALITSERLATVGRMTSLITHELRNPLSSIGLNAEMLSEALLELELEPARRDDFVSHLETIINEVDRLRDITEEYLVYARLPEPKLADEELVEIVEQLVDFHTWEWAQEGVDIVLDVDQRPLPLHADANQLRQALLNLVKNAVEATPPDHPVQIRLTRDGPDLLASVRDGGPGVPDELGDRIFEPFFTSKPTGTGLGLAMTRQIIEEHRGTLTYENLPEGGATFTVRLPCA